MTAARPLLTTPPQSAAARRPLTSSASASAAQPWLGLGGLLLGAVVFFALALGTGQCRHRRC